MKADAGPDRDGPGHAVWRPIIVATPILLRGEHITLAQAVKIAGLVDTGGQAKLLVRTGRVQVNGSPEVRPGRKLHAGDRVSAEAGREWIIHA